MLHHLIVSDINGIITHTVAFGKMIGGERPHDCRSVHHLLSSSRAMPRRIVIRNHRVVIIIRVLVCFTLCAFLGCFLLIGFVGINDRVLLLGQTGEACFQFRKINAGFQKFFLTVKRNTDTLLCLLQISLQLGNLCLAVRDCFLDRAIKEVYDALPVVSVRCTAEYCGGII